MVQGNLKLLRYNTGTDKKAFIQFKKNFDAAIFNATIVAYSGSSIADLVSMHSRRYIIDPQTHIFQQDISAYTTENKKSQKRTIKRSVVQYLDQMPVALKEKIIKQNSPPEKALIEKNLDSLVDCVYKFQTEYVNKYIKSKAYDKYLSFANMPPRPRLVIAPYFMIKSNMSSYEKNTWLHYNRICLEKTIVLNKTRDNEEISAQLVLEKEALSEELIDSIISTYAVPEYEYIFIWIDDFNSFEAKQKYNELFYKLINALNGIGKKPIMAYGGYESIILCNSGSPARLYGVAQSVGYGEYRSITPVGGGMPVNKYYFYPLHFRARFDDVATILSTKGYFDKNKNNLAHAHDFFNNICNCKTCHEIINDDINNFSIYNDSIPFKVEMKNGTLSKNRPTSDALLIAALHFLYCKVKEWEYIEKQDFSVILENLKASYAQYQPQSLNRIIKWCEIYGK